MIQPTSPGSTARYPVWDRAVRGFHWYLPIAIGVMWWSGEQGRMDIHEKVGYSLLCLVAARIIWVLSVARRRGSVRFYLRRALY